MSRGSRPPAGTDEPGPADRHLRRRRPALSDPLAGIGSGEPTTTTGRTAPGRRAVVAAAVALGVTLVATAAAPESGVSGPAAWSRFRGPNGSGVADASGLPTELGPDRHVVWKTPLPPGHSSPILSAERIFLTAFEEDSLWTYAIDRASGEVLWRTQAPRARQEQLDPRNSPASPSPVTDGEGVWVFFADFGLIAYDLDGNERWRLPLGPFDNIYGMGASPIVVGDKLILAADQSTGSYLMAVNKDSGEQLWKTDRPEARSGHATPILWEPDDGEPQIILPGSFLMTAYSLETGGKLWWVSGLSFEIKSTPVIHEGVVFVNGFGSPLQQPGAQPDIPSFARALEDSDGDGDGLLTQEEVEGTHAGNWFDFVDLDRSGALGAEDWDYFQAAMTSTNGMLAIRLGGEGDMTEENVVWTYHRAVPQLPSPLLYRGVLYMVNDGGIVTSLDPATGEVLAQGRLEGAVDSYYASPVAADGKIFFVSELGLVAVVAPGGGLDVVHVSDLDDLAYATPAIEDGRIYLRTRSFLYCFGMTD